MVFNVFYRPLFSFTWFLTCFIQTLFFDLHVFCMFLIGPLFHLQVFFFTSFIQAPFLHSHVFYMFHAGPLFSFTCFLHVSYTSAFFPFTCFLHVSYRPPFFIYMFFTCFLHAPFFPFTCFLQGFKRSISRLRVAFGRIIYTFFTGLSKAIYMFFYNGRYCKSA